MKRLPIIKTNVHTGTYEAFVDRLVELSMQKQSSYVCICNVHMLIEANNSSDFCQIVNNSDLVTPDGKPVAKGLELLYHIKQPRVAGMDLIETLFERCAHEGLSVFLYGSTEDVLQKITKKAKSNFANLKIVGAISPPFRLLSEDEKKEVVNKINQAQPDFVFVALGCPKQEVWMSEHLNKIHACMIGLGGAFPIYAETVKRSPKWMQDFGLEWVFRLYNEPGRLWKRYLYTNTKFLILFMIQWLHIRLRKERG